MTAPRAMRQGDKQAVVRQRADTVGGDDAHAAVDASVRRTVQVVDANLEGVVVEGVDGGREQDAQERAQNLDCEQAPSATPACIVARPEGPAVTNQCLMTAKAFNRCCLASEPWHRTLRRWYRITGTCSGHDLQLCRA